MKTFYQKSFPIKNLRNFSQNISKNWQEVIANNCENITEKIVIVLYFCKNQVEKRIKLIRRNQVDIF